MFENSEENVTCFWSGHRLQVQSSSESALLPSTVTIGEHIIGASQYLLSCSLVSLRGLFE